MAKCICGEGRQPNPRWRIKSQKPKGRDFIYKIVCLTCEWEWWSSAGYVSTLEWISQEEKKSLSRRLRFSL